MSNPTIEYVREFFEEQNWNITDEWADENDWSVTARTSDDLRVSVDDFGSISSDILIESEPIDVSSIDEYKQAIDIAGKEPDVSVDVKSAEGIFTRLKHSKQGGNLSEKEIVEALIDEGIPFGVKFSVTKSTEDVDIERIPKFVASVRSAVSELQDKVCK